MYIVVKDNSRGHFVDNGFVLTARATHAAIEHGLMGECRSEPLVEKRYRYFGRKHFAQGVDAGPYVAHRLRRLAVHGCRQPDNYFIDRLTGDIVENEFLQSGSRNSGQTGSDNTAYVGDGNSAPASSVVN